MKPTYGSVRSVLARAMSNKDYKLAWRKTVITAGNKIGKRCLRGLDLPKELAQSYDCAIAYRVGMPLDLVSYVVKAKVKCVWWHHGEFDYPESVVKNWRDACKQVDRIICVSEASRKMIEPHFPGFEKKMCVVPNMIIPEEIQRAAEAFEPYEGQDGKTILVSVGRMSAEKHMIDTVDVMDALIKRGHKNLLWYLVGDGVERKTIEKRIREFGLEQYFCLVGNQANPYPYIIYADLYVHPSWVESQGICVLEAMALKKKSVVVYSEGTDEFLEDGVNAIQAARSIQDLADKIESALTCDTGMNLKTGQEKTVNAYSPAAVMPMFLKAVSDTTIE
jgi:glycosyltransferase involved in cell wall biosynthesis